MMDDPRLRRPLTERRIEWMGPWCLVPPELSASRRARLDPARLLADGAWCAGATSVVPLPDDERAHVRAVALALLEDPSLVEHPS